MVEAAGYAMNRMLLGVAVAALFLLGLSACATRTPVSGHFPSILPRQAQHDQYIGRRVRWGGVLLQTTPRAKQTCFRVMGLPLDRAGRPEVGPHETEVGRFIACAPGFYDPALYAVGREITFIGTIEAVKTEKVGDYKYPYPMLAANVAYMWPKAAPAVRSQPYYYDMYYWGPWGWWGSDWWWGPWGLTPPLPYDRNPDTRRRPPPPPPMPGTTGVQPSRQGLRQQIQQLRRRRETEPRTPAPSPRSPKPLPPPARGLEKATPAGRPRLQSPRKPPAAKPTPSRRIQRPPSARTRVPGSP